MELYLYKFTKDFNSTAVPDSTVETVHISGQPRQPLDILHPSFLLLNTDSFPDFEPHRYNYAYCPHFGRYYYARGFSWAESAGWMCSFDVDVLASYREEIGASTQYILRSSNTFDGAIQDMYYPAKSAASVQSTKIPVSFKSELSSSGIYIVGIANGSDTTHGGISYYAFTESQFRAFQSAIFKNLDWFDLTETDLSQIGEGVLKSVFNPMQYILSCYWFPLGIDDISTGESLTSIKFGWWTIPVSGYTLGARVLYTLNASAKLPKHPQASRGKYLNDSPFTEYLLDFRPWGQIPLNPSQFVDADSIYLYLTADLITGAGILNISPNEDATTAVRTVYAAFGVPIRLSQVSVNVGGVASSAVSTSGGILSGLKSGNILGATSSAISGIGNAISCMMPQVETSGSQGSFADFNIQPQLVSTFRQCVGDDNEHNGRPLCQRKKISTIPGYILCENAEVPLRATSWEQEKVKSYLESGFFYE